jgi:glutathione S-transferase
VTPQLAKDREALFPVFAREDFGVLQESARSELRAYWQGAEEGFLRGPADGPFVGGEEKPTMADLYAVWMVKWWFETVGVECAGLGKEDVPRIRRW